MSAVMCCSRTASFLAFALLAACSSPASATGMSPVQKVIQLIEDMAAKVGADVDAGIKSYEEFAKYCADGVRDKGFAIKDSDKNIESLAATVTDSKATIESLSTLVEDVSGKVSDVTKELADEVDLRTSANADFKVAEKELLETVDSIAGAMETIKKSSALLQGSKGHSSANAQRARQAIGAAVEGLEEIVEASFVTAKQRDSFDAFLQQREDEDEQNESGAGGSDAILETLEAMEEQATSSLASLRNKESESNQAHLLLKQGFENKMASMQKELAESKQKKQASFEVLAQAEKDMAGEKKGRSEDQTFLRDLHHECSVRAQEFEITTRDGKAELTALAKAKAILSKKFASASFIQLASRTHMRSASKARTKAAQDDESRTHALRLIQKLGQRLHSTALVALAYRASTDPFAKVRDMIEDMIKKLRQEAAEGASQKAFCDTELGKSKASKQDKGTKLDKVNARLEKAGAGISTLSEEVALLSSEVAEGDASQAAATKLRSEEKAEFQKIEKELSESQEACAAAIQVLREYYEGGAALIQMSSRTRLRAKARSKSFATADTEAEALGASTEGEQDGSGILGVLELAESDFEKGLAEARSAEQVAADEFAKMTAEQKVLKATKEMEIKGKESEIKAFKSRISELSEDKEGLSDEMDAVLAYLDKLKPKCETKEPSHAEIQARRQAEIDGLKEALNVLSGEGGAALLQTDRFLAQA